jgi:uncharacterized protein YpuA (DUF1002 family)
MSIAWSRRAAVKRSLASVALFALALGLILAGPAYARPTSVVSLGADLNNAQRQQMFDLFGVSEDDVSVLEATNKEEREYLEGIVSTEQIGTRAISSVFVRIKDDGSGIAVETSNITYITEQTYANALVTAGIADADVLAAAPFPVSGTAALTGVFKAFEEATGEDIPQEAKEAATDELVTTAEVGDEVGDPAAVAELIKQAKEEIVRLGLDDEESVREVLVRISAELNIKLSDEQLDRLTEILMQIQKLDLDFESLQKQLEDFQTTIGAAGEQVKGFWESIRSFFADLWGSIFG